MLFHTTAFAIFLVTLLAILVVVRQSQLRKLVILGASYFFYMWWNPIFVLPLLATTTIDFTIARMLDGEERPGRRGALLLFSLTANLGLLAYFKYFNFFVRNLVDLAQALGFPFSLSLAELILPIGISFYTFHAMSYTIDVYRREIPACRSLLDFALFITFFPVLVAGPILRAKQFLPQLQQAVRLSMTLEIALLIVRGLGKKVVVADNLAPFVDLVFSDPDRWPSAIIWLATIAFSLQIYCDFSGYSDIARGLAMIFGFDLPLNFDRPYFARTPSEFWRRWHISLSTWLRDYLYIPLGGNRKGTARTYLNLMTTMLLGGLWHGASWNFVLWGFLHGAMLSIHRAFDSFRGGRTLLPRRLGLLVSWAALQYCVLLTWITFRVTDASKLTIALRKFVLFDFQFPSAVGGVANVGFVILIIASFWLLHTLSWRFGDLDRRIAQLPFPVAAAICVMLAALFFIFWPLEQTPYIYFQF